MRLWMPVFSGGGWKKEKAGPSLLRIGRGMRRRGRVWGLFWLLTGAVPPLPAQGLHLQGEAGRAVLTKTVYVLPMCLRANDTLRTPFGIDSLALHFFPCTNLIQDSLRIRVYSPDLVDTLGNVDARAIALTYYSQNNAGEQDSFRIYFNRGTITPEMNALLGTNYQGNLVGSAIARPGDGPFIPVQITMTDVDELIRKPGNRSRMYLPYESGVLKVSNVRDEIKEVAVYDAAGRLVALSRGQDIDLRHFAGNVSYIFVKAKQGIYIGKAPNVKAGSFRVSLEKKDKASGKARSLENKVELFGVDMTQGYWIGQGLNFVIDFPGQDPYLMNHPGNSWSTTVVDSAVLVYLGFDPFRTDTVIIPILPEQINIEKMDGIIFTYDFTDPLDFFRFMALIGFRRVTGATDATAFYSDSYPGQLVAAFHRSTTDTFRQYYIQTRDLIVNEIAAYFGGRSAGQALLNLGVNDTTNLNLEDGMYIIHRDLNFPPCSAQTSYDMVCNGPCQEIEGYNSATETWGRLDVCLLARKTWDRRWLFLHELVMRKNGGSNPGEAQMRIAYPGNRTVLGQDALREDDGKVYAPDSLSLADIVQLALGGNNHVTNALKRAIQRELGMTIPIRRIAAPNYGGVPVNHTGYGAMSPLPLTVLVPGQQFSYSITVKEYRPPNIVPRTYQVDLWLGNVVEGVGALGDGFEFLDPFYQSN